MASLHSLIMKDFANGQGINMESLTVGHRQDSMGVRGHSAGTVFPAVIYIKGSFSDGLNYHIMNHPCLRESYAYANYQAAEMAALCTPRHTINLSEVAL